MRNLNARKDYKNRHLDGLPVDKAIVRIIRKDAGEDVERVLLCQWHSYKKEDYVKGFQPHEGYLGTMRIVEEDYNGVGFNAWEQNNSEFIYYKLI